MQNVLEIIRADHDRRLEAARKRVAEASEMSKASHWTDGYMTLEKLRKAHEEYMKLIKEEAFLMNLLLGKVPLN
jgi:hypothetical protein